MHIALGNRLYSSWSLRPWLVLEAFGIEREETVIAMYKPDTKARMLGFGPTGKVPVIRDGELVVWDSLAIIEYLADRFPDHAIWPEDPNARAHARCASAEMHSGFMALRGACPMNLTKRFEPKDRGEGVDADVARIEALWAEARATHGEPSGDGPFLYGAFSGADAMFAPVVARLDGYNIPVSVEARTYMDSVLSHPAFVRWRELAEQEPWALPHYEEGETTAEVLYVPDEAQAE
ncbi:MAG: glutathione S-transferase family protein [Pseudomonadota bacterium]